MSQIIQPIPQTSPKANYLAHKAEIDGAISRVLESGWYILGQQVSAFEQQFAAYIGVQHAIGVANGTDALHLALRACGVGVGDTVMTVSHTAVATVAAIELAGATPILVDIDPTTYTIDLNQVEDLLRAMRQRPKAIVPVHLYGHPADMPAIMDIAQCYDLYVIEDCAQAHGATRQGKRMGAWGHIAAFSFYPTKNLGALGDGGIITTDDEQLAAQLRSLRQYGWQKTRYISQIAGLNSRLDELQAAILRVKLRYLDQENERRRELAQSYDKLLAHTDLVLPQICAEVEHVYHQYVVRSSQRDALRAYLRQVGIGTLIHYPVPVHLQPAYQNRLPKMASLQQTEDLARQILSLPMFPHLNESEIEQVSVEITRFYNEKAAQG